MEISLGFSGMPYCHHAVVTLSASSCLCTKFSFHSCLIGRTTSGVSQCGLAIYIKKDRKAKEELWKLKYFTMAKSSTRNQTLSRYYNSIITNLKFQHKPKYHLSKILI